MNLRLIFVTTNAGSRYLSAFHRLLAVGPWTFYLGRYRPGQDPQTPCPPAELDVAWTKLTGYIDESVADGRDFTALEIKQYMTELHREAIQPVRDWVEQMQRLDTE